MLCRCLRCNLLLSEEESQKRGLGPVCWRLWNEAQGLTKPTVRAVRPRTKAQLELFDGWTTDIEAEA